MRSLGRASPPLARYAPRWTHAGGVLALALVVLAVTACEDERQRTDPGLEYAALGDSFTAAPWIPVTSTDGCLRSDRNYPQLVARRLEDVRLLDVSCGGATTDDIPQSQVQSDGTVHPPQLEAVSESTDVVTVGMGANDAKFAALVLYECAAYRQTDPEGSPCRDVNGQRVDVALDAIRDRLVEVLEAVTARAPDARVLVIGYPRFLPDNGDCPQRMPLAQGDVEFVRNSFDRLMYAMEAAAAEVAVEYVDVAAASEGHDVCSDEPWVNAWDQKPSRQHGAPYHPTPAEQEAVAELILDLL